MEYKIIEEKMLDIFLENGIVINDDLKQEEINLDSFAYVTIIIDIENQFGIKILPEEINELYNESNRTIASFAELIYKKLNS